MCCRDKFSQSTSSLLAKPHSVCLKSWLSQSEHTFDNTNWNSDNTHMYIYYLLHRLFGFTYLFAKQLFFYVARENLNKIFQGTKIIWRIFQLQTGWLWAFVSQKTLWQP